MASRVIDSALGKVSQKYPNINAEASKKVLDSLQDFYKSYHERKRLNAEAIQSSPENHVLMEVSSPSVSSSSQNRPNLSRRDSLYENFENFVDKNPTPTGSTHKFSSESKPTSSVTGDSNASYQRLSENPSINSAGAENDKKEILCPPQPPAEVAPRPTETPNISGYLQKKSMAQGMMDLALLSANTNQLRYILDSRADNEYFSVSLTLIISSLVLQIVVGLMLVWNSQYNVQRRSGFASADRINNLSVFGVFLITLINVFVSTFGNVPSSGSPPTSSTSTSTTIAVSGGAETSTIAAIVASVESVIAPEIPFE